MFLLNCITNFTYTCFIHLFFDISPITRACWIYGIYFTLIGSYWYVIYKITSTIFQVVFDFCSNINITGYYWPDPATAFASGVHEFHDYLMVIAIFITFFVFSLLCSYVRHFSYNLYYKKFLSENDIVNRYIIFQNNSTQHSEFLEVFWILLPTIILAFIIIPSFGLLFAASPRAVSKFHLRVIGHQWFWSYEYIDPINYINDLSLKFLDEIYEMYIYMQRERALGIPLSARGDFVFYLIESTFAKWVCTSSSYPDGTFKIDSNMVLTNDLQFGRPRLLTTDNSVVVPTHTHISVIVTGADVLHSWAIPALGVKVDAVPGRLNLVESYIVKEGIYYGQCSEICGVNHGFMPISLVAMDRVEFEVYLCTKVLGLAHEFKTIFVPSLPGLLTEEGVNSGRLVPLNSEQEIDRPTISIEAIAESTNVEFSIQGTGNTSEVEVTISEEVDSNTSEVEVTISEEVDSNIPEVDSNIPEVDSNIPEVEVTISEEVDSNTSEVDSNTSEVDSNTSAVEVTISEVDSNTSEVEVTISEGVDSIALFPAF